MTEEDRVKSTLERWKEYGEMTNLGEIARRYFVMNFFDGVLTVLGYIIGNFVLYLNGVEINSRAILVPAIAVSVAIGISGISGGYLAEKAERQAEVNQLKRAMAMQTEVKMVVNMKNPAAKKFKEEDYYPVVELKEDDCLDLEPVCIEPESICLAREEEHPETTLAEKATAYATNVASLINGIAPAVGGLVGLIPLFFIEQPNLSIYIECFVVMAIILFLLGGYLARISEDTIWKYGPAMVLAGIITSAISMLLGV
ncbi:MAG: hypothetical protein GF364_11590 [Candidatus Lokiarchaeota archaeon]|nr:hypothetical protein [Candidatus Lokiarchaeota archaeon]